MSQSTIGIAMPGCMPMEGRTAQVSLRMTPADREELNRRAQQAGQSVQEYAISKLLDRPVKFKPGPPRTTSTQSEGLPMN